MLNSIRLRRIGKIVLSSCFAKLSDVTVHPGSGGSIPRPEGRRHDATPPTHDRGYAASGVLRKNPGSVRPCRPQLAVQLHKPPDRISEEELRQYFLYLINVKHFARASFTIALCV